MSDPWTTEVNDAKARLHELPALAPIPIVTPSLGDINEAIDNALKQSGAKEGDTGKVGVCFALDVMAGNATDDNATEAQQCVLHLELVVVPELNAGDVGQQLDVNATFWSAVKQLLSWDRGPGAKPLRFLNWDKVITKDEVTVSADFGLFQVLDLDT
jgi:hypothetical protein